jgi:hypothetical protein
LTFSSSGGGGGVFGVGVAEGALLVDGVPVSVPGFSEAFCPQDARIVSSMVMLMIRHSVLMAFFIFTLLLLFYLRLFARMCL